MIIDIGLDNKTSMFEKEIWRQLHMCTRIGISDGFFFKLTDKRPEHEQVGVVFRIFGKEGWNKVLKKGWNNDN